MNFLTDRKAQRTVRRAFSLIEVAIALLIFVVGALAIIRIFPGALGVVDNSGNRQLAINLNRETLAPFQSDADMAPDAVYFLDDALSAYNNFGAAVSGRLTRTRSLPRENVTDTPFSALRSGQQIIGEGVRVRQAGTGADTTQFILTQFPIQALQSPNSSASPLYLKQDIESLVLLSDGTLDFSNTGLDPTTFGTEPIYVSYRYVNGLVINGVIDEPMVVTVTGGVTNKVLQVAADATNAAVPGVVRAWRRVRLDAPTSPSPQTRDLGYAVVTNVRTGDIVYVDYVANWDRIISQRTQEAGDTNAAQIRRVTLPVAPTRRVDALVYGSTLAPRPFSVNAVDNPEDPDDNYDRPGLSLRLDLTDASIITPAIPAPPATDYDSLRFRTSHVTRDDWARQLAVAASSYIPYLTTRPAGYPSEPWREYLWSSADASTIYLPPSEAGKTLSVTYTYLDSTVSPAVVRTVTDEIVTVRDSWDTKAATTPPPFPYGTANYPDGSQVDARSIARLQNPAQSILSVRGLSVTARAAWLNRDKYAHVLTTIYRPGGDR